MAGQMISSEKRRDFWNYIFQLPLCSKFDQLKGQLISEEFFLVFSNSKKTNEFFLQISALVSKMGQIKKIQALYYIR
jgi:hypothetical protein